MKPKLRRECMQRVLQVSEEARFFTVSTYNNRSLSNDQNLTAVTTPACGNQQQTY